MEKNTTMGDDGLIGISISVLSGLGILNRYDLFSDETLISIGGTTIYSPSALKDKRDGIKKYWQRFSEPFEFTSFDDISRPDEVLDEQWNLMEKAIKYSGSWARNPVGMLSITEKESYKYPGSGKTTLARCIATYLLQTGTPVIFWRMPNISQAWFSDGKNLSDSIQKAFSSEFDDFKSGAIKVAQNCPVLILDDFGLQYQSDFIDYFFTTIITDRSDKSRPTVVTSPLALTSIQKQYPFISSRLQENSIVMGTPKHYDYRAKV
jgi:hypothetical protein